MFLGEHNHTIDDKSRIIIPSKFRSELGESFIITCGFEKCLVIYPVHRWIQYTEKISKLPSTDRDVRAFTRLIYSKAQEVSLDKMGRIVIPQNLKNYASIEKEAFINGNYDTIEIWAKDVWSSYSENIEVDFEERAQKISEKEK
ncbi:MAG: division/cell wall cluster transcriptional repressor MraZ [Candidatus Muiribacteriota bacterium]